MSVIVKEDFKVPRNGAFLQFTAGTVVKSEDLAEFLLMAKLPVEPVNPEEMVVCPHCHKGRKVENLGREAE